MSSFKNHPPSKSKEGDSAIPDPEGVEEEFPATAKLNYLIGLSSGGSGGRSHGDDNDNDNDDGSGSDTTSTSENVSYVAMMTLLERQRIQLEEHFRRELTLQVEQVMRVEEKCDMILGRGGEESGDLSRLRMELRTEREARLGNEQYFKTCLDKLMGEVKQLGLKIMELEEELGKKESPPRGKPPASALSKTATPLPVSVLSASALSSIQLQYGNEAAEMINDLSKEMQVNFREYGKSQQALRKDLESMKRDVARLSYSIEPPVEAVLGLGLGGPPPLTRAPQALLPMSTSEEAPLFNLNMNLSNELDFDFDNFSQGQSQGGSGRPRSHKSEDTMSVVELSGSEDDDHEDGDEVAGLEDDDFEIIDNNNDKTTTIHKLTPTPGNYFPFLCSCGLEFESPDNFKMHANVEQGASLSKSCLLGLDQTKSQPSTEKEKTSTNLRTPLNKSLAVSSNQTVVGTPSNQTANITRTSLNQTLKTSFNQDLKSSLNIKDPQITISIVPMQKTTPPPLQLPQQSPPKPPQQLSPQLPQQLPPKPPLQPSPEQSQEQQPPPPSPKQPLPQPPKQQPLQLQPKVQDLPQSAETTEGTPDEAPAPPTVTTQEISASSSSQLTNASEVKVLATPSDPPPARSHHVTRSRTNSIPTPSRKPGTATVLNRRFLRGNESVRKTSSSSTSNFRQTRPSPTITTATATTSSSTAGSVGTRPTAVKQENLKGQGSPSSQPVKPGPSTALKSNAHHPNRPNASKPGGSHVHHAEKNSDHALRGQDEDDDGNPRFFCKCGKSYGAKFAVYRHIREISIQKVFTCTQCPMQYSRLCVLRRHMRNSHKVDYCRGKFACSNCGQFFGNFKDVVEHRAKVHNKYK